MKGKCTICGADSWSGTEDGITQCRICGVWRRDSGDNNSLALRDQFAMAALTGLLPFTSKENAPREAYKMADAMMKAREGTPPITCPKCHGLWSRDRLRCYANECPNCKTEIPE